MTRAIATLLFVGLAPVAPGTFGSAAAILLAIALFALTGWWGLALGWLLLSGLGWWATAAESARTGDHDASEIVIDELSGQWIALVPAFAMAPGAVWPLVAAFLLFRVFDIAKPGPIGAADRWHTPLGVMLDDVLAGIAAAIVLAALLLVRLWFVP